MGGPRWATTGRASGRRLWNPLLMLLLLVVVVVAAADAAAVLVDVAEARVDGVMGIGN